MAAAAAIAHQSPDMTSSSQVANHMALPQVVKVGPGAVNNGLSVVSAAAPLAQRRDIGSAGLTQRAFLQQNVTYEKLGLKTGKLPPRATGPNGVRIKHMELNSNHAVVFS